MKVIFSLTILIATLVFSTSAQRYIVASTDQQLSAALKNKESEITQKQSI